ncbi:MAG TPA: ABC transporter permease [Egibacteraceae bacterium]
MVLDWGEVLGWILGGDFAGLPGLPVLVAQHLAYSFLPTAAAVAIALPLGLWVGHTGRGGTFAIQVSNAGRAIPSLGIIVLAFIGLGFGFAPVYVTLVLMAIPPILTNTYVGVREVDPDVRDSAEGLGLTGLQVLWKVEVPLALPVIMAGIRTSAVQVVATATLAAYVGLGGLGRPIFNGLAQNVQANPIARAQVVVAVVAVALLAVATELGLGWLERLVVPRPLTEPDRPPRREPAMEDSPARTSSP